MARFISRNTKTGRHGPNFSGDFVLALASGALPGNSQPWANYFSGHDFNSEERR